MSGPLSGTRVVDLTTAVLGPVATQILGDMGADVIKIEPPGGDPIRPLGPARHPGMGAYFLNINRNKKSVALDLKRPQARTALLRLVETADVFVHNMRLGAAERLGFNYPAVASRNPRIVYAAATGFAKDGRFRDRPSFDDVIQGESGLAALNGGVGGEPRYVPMAVCDKLCGYVLARQLGSRCSIASAPARARRCMCRCSRRWSPSTSSTISGMAFSLSRKRGSAIRVC